MIGRFGGVEYTKGGENSEQRVLGGHVTGTPQHSTLDAKLEEGHLQQIEGHAPRRGLADRRFEAVGH